MDTCGHRGAKGIGEETPPSMRLELTTPAREDLLDIWAYIAAHDDTAADNYLEGLSKRALELLKHPELGRKRDEILPGIRSLLFRNHLMFYRVEISAHSGAAYRSRQHGFEAGRFPRLTPIFHGWPLVG